MAHPCDTLTGRQRKAIEALLQSPTVLRASETCGASRSQMYRWLSDSSFRLALRSAQRELVDAGTRMLASATSRAVKTILEGEADSQPMGIRLRAATEHLIRLQQWVEIDDVIQRIEDIEARLNEHHKTA